MLDPDSLIQKYVEGNLTEEEAVGLHRMLEVDPSLGDRLLGHLHMDAMLRSTRPLVALPIVPFRTETRRRFGSAVLVGVAAVAACVTLMTNWAMHRWLPASEEATTASVALLSRGVNIEWHNDSLKPTPGAPLPPGWLRLKSGLVQIEFYQGARVSIEGPAALQLLSSGEAYCESGKLSAHVPPQAKGFRIHTPKGTIVDLGTAFGLDVSAAGAEVHVFEGEVEVHRPDAEMQSLKEGQAVAMQGSATVQAARGASFSTLTEIDARTAAAQRSEFEIWQTLADRRSSDPDLKLHFDFQGSPLTRSIRNRARVTGGIADGSIVGCGWTQGRWPGKQALEFRNVSDRVRISVPGEMKALTLSAWVRIGGLDRAFNSLFMSEGWGDRKIHWQITQKGEVRLGIAGPPGQRHHDYDSRVKFSPERFGQWTHLAVVYDPASKEVRHYLNGELTTRKELQSVHPLQIGLAELGNWNDRPGAKGVAIRHLSGAMDEFGLHARALTDTEIADLAR